MSGKPPWSECRRDEVVILHLAKGHRPRRPQTRPIDDEHWGFIEHCWLPVQERPSAEYLVSSVLDFLRSHPDPQPFCSKLVSAGEGDLRVPLSGPLLSLPNTEQLLPNVPLEGRHAFEHFQYPHQVTPENNSSTFPLLQRKPLTHSVPEGDSDNEAVLQVDRLHSFNQSKFIITSPALLVFPF